MTETASLIVDLHTIRCGGCKVHVEDPLIVSCTFCGATFDRVVSNHVGLAKRLMGQRADLETDEAAEEDTAEATATEELVAVPRSVLSDLASALGEIDGAGAAAAAATKLAESAPVVDAGSSAQAAVEAASAAREAGSLG
jgi:hypothetical protein